MCTIKTLLVFLTTFRGVTTSNTPQNYQTSTTREQAKVSAQQMSSVTCSRPICGPRTVTDGPFSRIRGWEDAFKPISPHMNSRNNDLLPGGDSDSKGRRPEVQSNVAASINKLMASPTYVHEPVSSRNKADGVERSFSLQDITDQLDNAGIPDEFFLIPPRKTHSEPKSRLVQRPDVSDNEGEDSDSDLIGNFRGHNNASNALSSLSLAETNYHSTGSGTKSMHPSSALNYLHRTRLKETGRLTQACAPCFAYDSPSNASVGFVPTCGVSPSPTRTIDRERRDVFDFTDTPSENHLSNVTHTPRSYLGESESEIQEKNRPIKRRRPSFE